jgi:hypothetical protein
MVRRTPYGVKPRYTLAVGRHMRSEWVGEEPTPSCAPQKQPQTSLATQFAGGSPHRRGNDFVIQYPSPESSKPISKFVERCVNVGVVG